MPTDYSLHFSVQMEGNKLALFSFGSGRRYANSVADHLGIERNIFGTGLLEEGITWAHFKQMEKANVTIDAAAWSCTLPLLSGLYVLEKKFGKQDEISNAINILKNGTERNPSKIIDTANATKHLFTIDQQNEFADPLSIMRHQLFSTVIKHGYHIPGGLDAARILAVLWASVAERAMLVVDIAKEVQISVERTDNACKILYGSSLMERGEASNGSIYFRLSDEGMIVGRRLAVEWKRVLEAVPFSGQS